MNDIMLGGILDYLESCPGVTIKAIPNPPVIPVMINNWESESNHRLPKDMIDFLEVCDGLNYYG